MIQNALFKILMAPFSLLYGLGVSLRNTFYKTGVLKSISFNLPIISVGNLSVGGAGKTPHIEYLIRLLKDYLNVATVSRGYKRKTKGFLFVKPNMNAEQVGDEPLQFKRKFQDVVVTVSESRTFAIPEIVGEHPQTQVVLLDDAFQHRSIQPGLNILLTEFSKPFTKDFLLPSGRLREWRSAYQRADVIVVSKCPKEVSLEEKEKITTDIAPLPNQKVFFSYYDYDPPYFLFNSRYRLKLEPDMSVLLICAIARTDYLVDYLNEKVDTVRVLEYEDHHFYSNYEIANLQQTFEKWDADKKVILTTEKDAMRLELHFPFIKENKMPVFALPVRVKFHFDEGEQFDETVKEYLLGFKE